MMWVGLVTGWIASSLLLAWAITRWFRHQRGLNERDTRRDNDVDE